MYFVNTGIRFKSDGKERKGERGVEKARPEKDRKRWREPKGDKKKAKEREEIQA